MSKYIPKNILTNFLESFQQGDIWQVHQLNERWLIVFLYYYKQIELNKELQIYQTMKELYFKLVKQHLDTQLESSNDISIQFDSKENFEKKYQGNWYD